MVSEVLDELLVSGEVVISWAKGHQPFKLLLRPPIYFWSFDTDEGDGNPLKNGAKAGMSWLTRRYMENSLMKLSALEQSPSKTVGNVPIGFPSCWAGWMFPPPGMPPPPPPGSPPPPPGGPSPDRPVPPIGALDCIWVVMAVAINILV